MSATQVVLVIIAFLVLVAIAVLAVAVGKRNAQRKRDKADQLRSDAARQTPAVAESLRMAEESGARARLARLSAERAEQAATEAREAAVREQERQRQALREADLIDPDRDSAVEAVETAEAVEPGAGSEAIVEGDPRYGLESPGKHSAA